MTDWLTYEWELNGERATFRVDMQYWELLPVLSYSQLVYVCVSPKNPGSKSFSQLEQYAFRQLRHRLLEGLADWAIHVGSIYSDSLRTLYFYAAETEAIHQASAICRKAKHLAVTCAHASEPHFVTYYKLLYPNDSKLQSAENAAYVEAMKKKGGDLAAIRRVRLVLRFLNEEDRSAFLQQVPRLGFTPVRTFFEEGGTHPACCVISGFCSLELPRLNRFTARAIDAAAPLEGMLTEVEAEFVHRY